jgi:hypothetical protein
MIDVKRTVADRSKQNIVIADDELTLAKAHREAPVTTPSRLKEHDGPTRAHQVGDGASRLPSRVDTWRLRWARHASMSLEEPERLGAVTHEKVLRL